MRTCARASARPFSYPATKIAVSFILSRLALMAALRGQPRTVSSAGAAVFDVTARARQLGNLTHALLARLGRDLCPVLAGQLARVALAALGRQVRPDPAHFLLLTHDGFSFSSHMAQVMRLPTNSCRHFTCSRRTFW